VFIILFVFISAVFSDLDVSITSYWKSQIFGLTNSNLGSCDAKDSASNHYLCPTKNGVMVKWSDTNDEIFMCVKCTLAEVCQTTTGSPCPATVNCALNGNVGCGGVSGLCHWMYKPTTNKVYLASSLINPLLTKWTVSIGKRGEENEENEVIEEEVAPDFDLEQNFDDSVIYYCELHTNCPLNFTCQEAKCVSGCNLDDQQEADDRCGPGNICSNDACVPGCRNSIPNCLPGYFCEDGFCEKGCSEDAHCALGNICYEGDCNTGCHDDNNCAPWETCDGGICQPDPNYVYPCTADYDCAPDQYCDESGNCILDTQSSSTDEP